MNDFFNEMKKKYEEETGKIQIRTNADLFYFIDWISRQLKMINPDKPLSEILNEMKKQNHAF